MKNDRDYTKGYYISAVAAIVLGVALLAWPDTSLQTFCYALGGVAVIFGLVKIIMYFMKDRLENLMEPELVTGVTSAAFGAFVLLKSEFILSILPFFTGVFLLIGAIMKLQNAIDMKRLGFRAWWLVLIISIGMFGLGGLLVANPLFVAKIVVILIGAGLTADGVVNLFDMFMLKRLLKKFRQMEADAGAIVTEAQEIYEEPEKEEDVPEEENRTGVKFPLMKKKKSI